MIVFNNFDHQIAQHNKPALANKYVYYVKKFNKTVNVYITVVLMM